MGCRNIRRRLSDSIQRPWPRPTTMVVKEIRESGKHEVWCLYLNIIKYISVWTFQTSSVWLTWFILLSDIGAWCPHFLPGNLFTVIYVCNGKCLTLWCMQWMCWKLTIALFHFQFPCDCRSPEFVPNTHFGMVTGLLYDPTAPWKPRLAFNNCNHVEVWLRK